MSDYVRSWVTAATSKRKAGKTAEKIRNGASASHKALYDGLAGKEVAVLAAAEFGGAPHGLTLAPSRTAEAVRGDPLHVNAKIQQHSRPVVVPKMVWSIHL